MNAFGTARNIVVLGGDSSIARSIVESLRAGDASCRIVLGVRDPARRALDPGVIARLAYDAEDGAQVGAVLAEAAVLLGDVDVVIVAAGVLPPESTETPVATVARAIRVNFEGAVCAVHAANALLAGSGGGVIALVSSVAAVRVRPAMPVYGATKHGADAHLRAVVAASAAQGVAGVVIRPGFVTTPMTAHLSTPRGASTPEEVGAVAAAAIRRAVAGRCLIAYVRPAHRLIAAALRVLPVSLLARTGR